MKLQSILKATIKEINLTPLEINSGNCDEFAFKVQEKLKGVKVYEVDFDNSDVPMHYWIKYKGKFYDAECLRGVKDYHKLPIFKPTKGYRKPKGFKDQVNIY